MPIDADGEMVDGKPERLPKQISRHLLPEREDQKVKELLDDAINSFSEDLGLPSRHKASIAGSSPSRHLFTSLSPPRGESERTDRPRGSVCIDPREPQDRRKTSRDSTYAGNY
jgi:hypothetical protein